MRYDYIDDDIQVDLSHLEKYSFAGELFPFEKKSKIRMFERELKKVARNSTETPLKWVSCYVMQNCGFPSLNLF